MNKIRVLFYYEEAVSAWIPAPERLDNIFDEDDLEDKEAFEIRFAMFEMTEDEFNNLPVE